MPLDNFSSVSFSSTSATQNGGDVDLSEASAMPITLLNANEQPLAVPSAIDSDGASFDVTRTAAPATTGNGTGRGRRGGGPRP